MAVVEDAPAPMSHRETLEALSGLLMGMFVTMLSATIVINALPVIIADLDGSQAAYTWVVTATLLATTVGTPLWGKLADLFSKKLLVQTALAIFVVGSVMAALSPNTGFLIASRAVQGIGAGGMMALVQVVIGAMVPPRERGRYSGYIGAVFGLATVGGPLIGGVIVEQFGWHWCFLASIPFALVAAVLLHKTLHLPVVVRTKAKIDYLGAFLLTGGVALVLAWVTLAGRNFEWLSVQTLAMLGVGVSMVLLAIRVETSAEDPVLPLRFFRSRTFTLSSLAGACVGVSMFGASVFLSQYFQISRGLSPTEAGLGSLPLVLGLVVASTVSGNLIAHNGLWKRWLVLGGILMTIGYTAMSTLTALTPLPLVFTFMAVLGAGTGLLMQNLVLAVQNDLPMRDLGAGSSAVAFFRSMGGAAGVAGMGAVLANRVSAYLSDGFRAAGIATPSGSGVSIPDVSQLPANVRPIVESAFGDATGDIFLIGVPFAVVALATVLFIEEVPLRRTNADPAAPTSRSGA